MSEQQSLSSLAPGKACQNTNDYDKKVNWGSVLLWFIIVAVIVWFILFAINPSWLRQKSECGKNTYCIDYGKLFLATIVITILLMVLVWLVRSGSW